jgi:subtilisin family serine protease
MFVCICYGVCLVGTHCAGTIGGTSVGVAPKANIYGLKVMNSDGHGSTSRDLEALDMVYGIREANPALPMVVSMSIGGSCINNNCETDSENVAIERMSDANITVVVAAGNEQSDACQTSPGGAPSAVTVGATEDDDSFATYSNYGGCIDVLAPGTDVISACAAYICGSEVAYVEKSGTSMACPHVAGELYISQYCLVASLVL